MSRLPGVGDLLEISTQFTMKYLAILKDSIRETLDSKVLYVLMGMSLLVIVIVAGMTFEPQPASIGLISIFQRFPGAVARPFQETEPPLHYDVIELTQTEGEKNRPWEGAYRFTLIVGQKEKQTWPFLVWLWTLSADEKDMDPQDMSARKRAIALRDRSQRVDRSELEESFKKEIDQVSDGQMERFIAKQLSIHGSFEANQIQRLKDPDIRPSEYRFQVDARPVAGSFATWPHTWKWFSVAVSQDTSLGSLVQFIELNVVGTWGAGIAMLISSIIPPRLLNISWIGTCSAFFTRELAMMTNRDKPEPEMKYIQGLPLPARGFASSLFQPSDRQNGKSRSTESVT